MIKKKEFKPTTAMVKAAEAVFMTKAYADMIRPIVRGYQQEILDYEKYEYDEKQFERRGKTPKDWIKKPGDTYLMRDNDFQHYLKRCRQEQEKAGLKTDSPEQCPLLVAEDQERKAINLLIEAMIPITGIDSHKLLCSGMDNYDEYVNLTLRLLAPFVSNRLKD
jgi:hypothetical protein